MSTAATTGGPRAGGLFAAMFDDAALFPPGNAPMVRAVPGHLAYRQGADADLVGPFLCPASRLAELRAAVGDGEIDVRVVVDTGIGGLEDAVAAIGRDDRPAVLQAHGLEIALRADVDLATAARRVVAAVLAQDLDPGLPVFVEVPLVPSTEAALDVLAEYDVLAKLRTGGADAAAHPGETEVARFIVACLDREIAFKCTAGLHHGVRRTDPATGFEQHGFLNILLAVSVALAGGDAEVVAAELADRDPAAVVDRVVRLSDERGRTLRQWFRSFGTCSVDEPVDDLVALGLLVTP